MKRLSLILRTLLVVFILFCTVASQGQTSCIGDPEEAPPLPETKWTDIQIRQRLNSYQNAVLCAGAVFEINDTITFPAAADNLAIYTVGNPTDGTRALLKNMNSSISTVVMAAAHTNNGAKGHNGAQLHHVIVDGGYDRFGKCTTSCTSLIWFGGPTSGQKVHHVKAINPRGWSTISLDRAPSAAHNGCNYAEVYENEVRGPIGAWPIMQADPDVLTDGLSIRCEWTQVFDNDIYDATDIGIAIFGAPFSTFENNYIEFNNNKSVGGISMSDQWGDWDGSYDDVQVRNNYIHVNTYTRIAISMGRMLQTCTELNNNNWGATVTGNRVYGYAGYSYAVAGVWDWTVTGNYDYASHIGRVLPSECDGKSLPSPRGFVKQAGYSTGTFQPEFYTTLSTQSIWKAELRYP